MGNRYRLTARAQMHGEVREPGYEFTLEEGEKGPMRSSVVSHDRVHVLEDNKRILGEYVDVLLYEPVEKEECVMTNAKPEPAREELLELRAFLDLFDRTYMSRQTHPTRSEEANIIVTAKLLMNKYPRGQAPVSI